MIHRVMEVGRVSQQDAKHVMNASAGREITRSNARVNKPAANLDARIWIADADIEHAAIEQCRDPFVIDARMGHGHQKSRDVRDDWFADAIGLGHRAPQLGSQCVHCSTGDHLIGTTNLTGKRIHANMNQGFDSKRRKSDVPHGRFTYSEKL